MTGFVTRARTAFAILLLCLLTGSHLGVGRAHAQQTDSTRVRDFQFEADDLVMRRVNGVEINELVNPRIRSGTSFVRARRGVRQGDDEYLFYDRVVIIDESDTLTADRVLYNSATRIGRAVGNVRLGDGEIVATSPEGDYDANEKRADFRAGVTLVDSSSTLSSLTGSYWTEDKLARFQGEVRLVADSLEILADSMVYRRDVRESEAHGRVVVLRTDPDDETWIVADHAVNDEETGRARIDGNIMLFRMTRDSTSAEPDTLMLSSERVWSIRTDSLDRYSAADSVRLWRSEFSAVADSMAFERGTGDDSTSVSRLMGSPIAWFRETQISGDTLWVAGTGEALDTLRVVGNAFVARRDTLSDRLQQLKGGALIGLFEADSLRSIDVSGQAEALYWLEKTETRDGGAVRVSADRVLFHFRGDEVTDLRVYAGVEGTYYPENLLTQANDLDGLAWNPGRRPEVSVLRRAFMAARCRMKGEACADSVTDLPPEN